MDPEGILNDWNSRVWMPSAISRAWSTTRLPSANLASLRSPSVDMLIGPSCFDGSDVKVSGILAGKRIGAIRSAHEVSGFGAEWSMSRGTLTVPDDSVGPMSGDVFGGSHAVSSTTGRGGSVWPPAFSRSANPIRSITAPLVAACRKTALLPTLPRSHPTFSSKRGRDREEERGRGLANLAL